MSPFSSRVPRARLAAVATTSLALALGMLSAASSAEPATSRTSQDQSQGTSSGTSASAPALVVEVAPRWVEGSRRGVVGEHLRVRLRASALPSVGARGRVAMPLDGGTRQVAIDRVEQDGAVTAWAGTLAHDPLSSFSLVEVGGTFRGSLISPEGTYALTAADGGDYWWSEVEPQRSAEGPDTVSMGDGAHVDARDGAGDASRRTPDSALRGKRRAKITVLFAYTRAAKAEAGTKAQLKASAALVVAQSNEAFRNSGLKVTMRYRGLVKAKGKESPNVITNVRRLFKPRDGRFDNLHKARRKKHADLVHLFTTGSQYDLCGAGNLPYSARGTHPALAFSTSFYSCMPYLVATHEFGHNLGADHIDYPGVSHDSKIPYAYGFYNVAGGYISVMGYYAPCENAGVYTCVRVPWFSSPTATYNGQPLGTGKATNNAKVVAKIAPKVARYRR